MPGLQFGVFLIVFWPSSDQQSADAADGPDPPEEADDVEPEIWELPDHEAEVGQDGIHLVHRLRACTGAWLDGDLDIPLNSPILGSTMSGF